MFLLLHSVFGSASNVRLSFILNESRPEPLPPSPSPRPSSLRGRGDGEGAKGRSPSVEPELRFLLPSMVSSETVFPPRTPCLPARPGTAPPPASASRPPAPFRHG